MHDAAARVVAMVGEADSSLPISHLAQGTALFFFAVMFVTVKVGNIRLLMPPPRPLSLIGCCRSIRLTQPDVGSEISKTCLMFTFGDRGSSDSIWSGKITISILGTLEEYLDK